MSQRRLKLDPKGHPIQSGVLIEDVLEVAITASSFVAVAAPSGVETKSIYITTRDQSNFLLSNESDGNGYATIPSGFGIDFASESGETLFYAKGTSTTTLEVILLG